MEAGTESDRVNTMLTSDLPDVIIGLLNEGQVTQNAELFFVSTSIVEGIDDAKWEAYLSQLQSAGYYDWVEWYNEHLLK